MQSTPQGLITRCGGATIAGNEVCDCYTTEYGGASWGHFIFPNGSCTTTCTAYGNGACNGGYTSYSGPSGGYVSGTTCINTTYYSPTYICPNGGTLSGTSCIKSMSSSLQATTHCLTN